MTQQELNKYMLDAGSRRYQMDYYKAQERCRVTQTTCGRVMLREMLAPVSEAIDILIKSRNTPQWGRSFAHGKLKQFAPDLVAFLTARTVIDSVISKRPRTGYTTLVRKIGQTLEDEERYTHLKKSDPGLWKTFEKSFKVHSSDVYKRKVIVHAMNKLEKEFKVWPVQEKVRIGVTLLDLFVKITGAVEVENIWAANLKTQTIVKPSPGTDEWIEKFHGVAENRFPSLVPMVDEPDPWTTPFSGGYPQEVLPLNCLVKKANKGVRDILDDVDLTRVYEPVNILQKTPWKINKKVYEVFKECVELGLTLGDLPSSQPEELPQRPDDIETNPESLSAYKQEAARVRDLNIANSHKRLRIKRLLNICKDFSEVDKFYFPYNLDFRGRVYSQSHFLNPQDDDVSRSLLLFSNSKPISSDIHMKWLAIHGANTYGHDKIPFDMRHQWVEDNTDWIHAIAQAPMDNTGWSTADSPWQFLAFCFEWSRVKKGGFGTLTSLPVNVDGTNNGLQILSILGRDVDGLASTNCLPSDHPRDIYQDVAEVCKKKLEELDTEESRFWLEFGVDRKVAKRPVMILPYGGTKQACVQYTLEWFKGELASRKERMDFSFVLKRVNYLSNVLWDSIHSVVKKPQKIMNWMQTCASNISKENGMVKWETPLGFPVHQYYYNMKKISVKTMLGDGLTKATTVGLKDKDKVSVLGQKNGISPNYVHSLDATVLLTTVSLANKLGIGDFFVVHDSYGTLCTDLEEMSACIRTAFYNIFKENLLQDFFEQLQAQTSVSLPPPPEIGDWDVSELLESEYFFS